MVTQGANVRQGVLVVSSIVLTTQLFALVASVVFYLYAATGEERTRNTLARAVITRLYPREQWRWLRETRALEASIDFQGPWKGPMPLQGPLQGNSDGR